MNRPSLHADGLAVKQRFSLFLLSTPGQPINLAAAGLWHVDQHGGAEPGHQSADQDPRGRVWPGVPRGDAPAYVSVPKEYRSGNGENTREFMGKASHVGITLTQNVNVIQVFYLVVQW